VKSNTKEMVDYVPHVANQYTRWFTVASDLTKLKLLLLF